MTKQANKVSKIETVIVPKTEYIQLSKLSLSDLNVRKSKEPIKNSFLASIRKNGILQNIIILKTDKKYEVIAGERRFTALCMLRDNKEIKNTYPVNCLVTENAKEAVRLSLVENLEREKMNVVDQLNAFNNLLSSGSSIADISVSFGYSKVHVKRILALSSVHSTILEAFKNNKINMESLEAFTANDNQEKQLECFKALHHFNPSGIRKILNDTGYPSTSKMAMFVGKAEYKKAGGVINTDLFNSEIHYVNGDLLRKLAREKLIELTNNEKISNGFKWVEIDTEGEYSSYDYDQMEGEHIKVPDSLEKELTEAKKTYQELEWNSDEDEKYGNLIESLEAKKDSYLVFKNKQKEFSGVVTTYNKLGTVTFHRGLTRGEDMQNYLNATRNPTSDNTNNENDDLEKTIKPEEKGFSQALIESINNHDKQLTQLSMLKDPATSAQAYFFHTCYDILSDDQQYGWGNNMFSSKTDYKINQNDDLLKETDAYKAIMKIKKSINTDWIKDTVQESYTAFCNLESSVQNTIFGQTVALSADTYNVKTDGKSIYKQVFVKTGLIKHEYYTPTKSNYFGRLDLDNLKKVCAELFGDDWLTERSNLAKGKLAVNAEEAYLLLEEQTFLPESMINKY